MRLLFILLLAAQVSAQGISLRKGAVIDSLRVSDSINDSYSLYLPQEFDGRTPMPAIFIFDGQGRGKGAAHIFQPAAEEQGYILVSSNSIDPEKSFEANVTSAIGLIQEVTSFIPIVFEEISVAGYLEGARVATAIPLLIETINGVIYVNDQQIGLGMLEEPRDLVMVAIAGNQQISSVNMELTSQGLNRSNVRSEFYTYAGGKEWPTPDLISSAVGSLTLQAIRNGKRPKNQELIDELYTGDIALVNKYISNERYLLAYDLLELFQFKFKDLRDVSELKDKQRQLRKTRNYKKRLWEAEEILAEENILINDYIYYLNTDVAKGNFENLGWWNYQKLHLDSLAISDKPFEEAMGKRLLDFLEEGTQNLIPSLEGTGSLESKLLANMLITVFDQRNFDAYKRIISLSAVDGDFSTALFYLEEMLKNGYSDFESLYEIEGTLGLRLTEDFNWLVDKYLGSSKYYSEP